MGAKLNCITDYFEKWENDVKRAEFLMNSEDYFLEGLIVIVCYIGALGALRYPNSKDWKAYKDIISNYSGHCEIFNNIDLLLFYQFKDSKLAGEKVYNKLKNYDAILELLKSKLGAASKIKENKKRFVKKEYLSSMIKSEDTDWYDEKNFIEHIQLFSNNRILYKYARCEAVHNAHFSLVNPSFNPETGKRTYRDNHQVDRNVILSSLKNVVANLKDECVKSEAWPYEL